MDHGLLAIGMGSLHQMQFRIPTNLRVMGNMCDQISTSISLFLHYCCMYYSLVGSVPICFFHLPWSYVHQCMVAEFYPCSCSSHPSARCQHQGPPTNFVYRALLIHTFFFQKESFIDTSTVRLMVSTADKPADALFHG